MDPTNMQPQIDIYDSMSLPKIKISEIDATKIASLGLPEKENKLLLFIYYYLQLSGLFEGQNILLISIDIIAYLQYPDNTVDTNAFMESIHTFFRNCDTTNSTVNTTPKTFQPTQTTVKGTLADNISILQNMKQVLEKLLSSMRVPLTLFEDIVKKYPNLPDVSTTAITFQLYLERISYGTPSTDNNTHYNIDLTKIYTQLLTVIDSNIDIMKSSLDLDNDTVVNKIKEYKKLYVKPIFELMEEHIEQSTNTTDFTITTDYIITFLSIQLHTFLFDIPIYSYQNVYEKQLHIQKRLTNILQHTIYLCKLNPFDIKLDISFHLLQKIVTLDINLNDILAIIHCKRTNSTFSIDTFFEQLVIQEIEEYIAISKDTVSSLSLSERIQNILFELEIHIFDSLLPSFNSFTTTQPVILDTTDPMPEQTIDTLQTTIDNHVCKGKSSEKLTELIKVIYLPEKKYKDATEVFFSIPMDNSENFIETFVDNPNMLFFSITSVTQLEFIYLLDLFLGLCSDGVIRSFGTMDTLSNALGMNKDAMVDTLFEMVSKKNKNIVTITSKNTFNKDVIENAVTTTYYLETSCKDTLTQSLQDSQFTISTDVVSLRIVI